MLRTRSTSAPPLSSWGLPSLISGQMKEKKLRGRGLLIASYRAAPPRFKFTIFCGSWHRRVFVCARIEVLAEKKKETHLKSKETVWRRSHVALTTLSSEIFIKKLEKSSRVSFWGRRMMLMFVCERARVVGHECLSERWFVCLTKAARLSRLSHPRRQGKKAARFEV